MQTGLDLRALPIQWWHNLSLNVLGTTAHGTCIYLSSQCLGLLLRVTDIGLKCTILVLLLFTDNLHLLHQSWSLFNISWRESAWGAISTISSAYNRIDNCTSSMLIPRVHSTVSHFWTWAKMSITRGRARNQSENTFCCTFWPKLKFYACQLLLTLIKKTFLEVTWPFYKTV